MTATLNLTGDQIIALFAQLDPKAKREILYRLAETASAERVARMAIAERALKQRAKERGLDWATMQELEREAFIDDLVHEDR